MPIFPPIRPGLCTGTFGLLLLAISPFSQPLSAHSGLPEATRVQLEQSAEPLPLVVTTFGVLAPRDAHDWTWVCPDVTGEVSLTSFFALPDGTWLMGTIGGLWRSPDRCVWNPIEGPIAGLYVTQIQADTGDPGRLWVSTSTGGGYNALWYSDDSGLTFQEGVYFGAGSTIRGFLQGAGGGPWFVVGWRDSLPHLWHSQDGLEWTEHRLAEDGSMSYYPLGLDAFDASSAYLAVRSLDGMDTLHRVSGDGALEPLLALGDQTTAFASGFSAGELFVGGRYVGMYHSSDDGVTWSGPEAIPEAGCLYTSGDRRYQCVNNYADGAAVLGTTRSDSRWEPVVWFGDVHGVEACPVGTRTADICEPLWEVVKYTAGLDLSESTPEPTPEPETGDGGSCAGCGASDDAPAGALLALFGVGRLVRRRSR